MEFVTGCQDFVIIIIAFFKPFKAEALTDVAVALVDSDADRAVAVAHSITKESVKAKAFARLAAAIPDRCDQRGGRGFTFQATEDFQ